MHRDNYSAKEYAVLYTDSKPEFVEKDNYTNRKITNEKFDLLANQNKFDGYFNWDGFGVGGSVGFILKKDFQQLNV